MHGLEFSFLFVVYFVEFVSSEIFILNLHNSMECSLEFQEMTFQILYIPKFLWAPLFCQVESISFRQTSDCETMLSVDDRTI